jgi:hypothetical protein
MTEPSLYERLGGAFAIAAVIDHFSDAVVRNQITGQGSPDPELDEWSRDQLARLPGLKFMGTLWVCELAGGPQVFGATKPGKTHFGQGYWRPTFCPKKHSTNANATPRHCHSFMALGDTTPESTDRG